MSWLLIQDFQQECWAYRIREGVVTIGRSPMADIRIAHSSVSRSHARLITNGSNYLLQDLGSQNGTTLNDCPVIEAQVRLGDRIRFAAVEANVVDDLDEALKRLLEVGSTREHAGAELTLRNRLSELTDSQQRVLRWLLRGLAEKQIAAELQLSRHTVHFYVKQIYDVLDVGSRPELMAKLWTTWSDV